MIYTISIYNHKYDNIQQNTCKVLFCKVFFHVLFQVNFIIRMNYIAYLVNSFISNSVLLLSVTKKMLYCFIL